VIAVRFVQFLNAPASIRVNVFGSVIFVNDDLFSKQPEANVFTTVPTETLTKVLVVSYDVVLNVESVDVLVVESE
jgi:hypothetical protein